MPPREAPVVFVCDESAEADRFSDLLRARGRAVVDLPLAWLVARIAVQRPALVVLDIDADGAFSALSQLRGLPDGGSIAVIVTTERAHEGSHPLDRTGVAVVRKPVNASEMLANVERLLHRPLPPRVTEAPSPPPPGALPSEIEALLQEAEPPLLAEAIFSRPAPPSPEEEVDAVLPEEVLAALDEPLGSDDSPFYEGLEATGEAPGLGGVGVEAAAERSQGLPAMPVISPNPPPVFSSLPLPGAGPAPLEPPRRERPPSRRFESAGAKPTVAPGFMHAEGPITPRSWAAAPTSTPPLTPRSGPHRGPVATLSASSQPRSSGPSLPPRSGGSLGGKIAAPAPPLPEVLREGDLLKSLALLVGHRTTGSLSVASSEGVRRIVLREGDFVTASSGVDDESLLAFLVSRGDLPKATGRELRGKLPAFGRRAGAALIAYGHLEQDQLWPVLRAHVEWIIACAIALDRATCSLDAEPPERLQAEPSVFGGAPGAEVFVEITRRIISAEVATAKLGGPQARIGEGARPELLGECRLGEAESAALSRSLGATVAEVTGQGAPELPAVLYALSLLGVISSVRPLHPKKPEVEAPFDPLDGEALRTRVRARLELVREGDYFAVLGVMRTATAYEIRRAYLDLRRAFEPSRVLTAQTADLADDMRLIVEVLDEAYEILRDATRRERYRRAIEG